MSRQTLTIEKLQLSVEIMTGEVSTKDLQRYSAADLESSRFHPDYDILIWISPTLKFGVTPDDARLLAAEKSPFGKGIKRVYCVQNNSLVFGTLRLYQLQGSEISKDINVVDDFDEACRILGRSSEIIFSSAPELKGTMDVASN